MGMFSKTKTYVESTTVTLYEEVNPTLQQTILNAVLKDRPLTDDLMASYLYGLGANADTYFRYGRDEYVFGLPEGTTNPKYAQDTTVQLVLEDILNKSVNITGLVFGVADPYKFAQSYLINTRGLDLSNNRISTNPSGVTGILQVIDVVFTNVNAGTSTSVDITYEDVVTDLTYTESVNNIFSEPVYINERYYQVNYTEEGSNSFNFWAYREALETYEVLTVTDTGEPSTFFPVVPLRLDNENLFHVDRENTDQYKTSIKLLDKIGIDALSVVESINENPDIDDIDHAYVILGVKPDTDHWASKDYLFRFFKKQYQTSLYTIDDYNSWLSGGKSSTVTPPVNKITIKEQGDGEEKHQYHIELEYLYISSTIGSGNLSDLDGGEDAKLYEVRSYIESRGDVTGEIFKFNQDSITFRKQITRETYEEYVVVGLHHSNYVYKTKSVDSNLSDLNTDNDDFIIPLDYDVVKDMPIFLKTDLMQDAIRITFNSVVRQKVKWYQTSAFAALIQIVALVITVYTLFSDGGSTLGAAAAITGSTSVALNLFVTILLNIAINEGLKFLVSVLGKEFAVLAAIVLTVYGMADGNFLGFDSSTALKLQSGILNGVNHHIRNDMADIMNEYEQLQLEQQEEQAELDALLETLPVSYLDPMSVLDATVSLALPGESPEQYYYTRIHSGNIGALAFDEISSFVDNNLRLEGVTPKNSLRI